MGDDVLLTCYVQYLGNFDFHGCYELMKEMTLAIIVLSAAQYVK